jgi:hypothetical protein
MGSRSEANSDRLPKGKLVSLVRKLMNAEGSEDEQRRWLDVLEANFEHPAPSDLIFWPDQVPGFNNSDPSAEEVVEFGLSYQRRILPREELVRLVDSYMHPRRPEDTEQEAYYLISENLRGVEINHLCVWAHRRGFSAGQLVERAQKGDILTDSDFQQSLTETSEDECG